jgi:hypothetical protein
VWLLALALPLLYVAIGTMGLMILRSGRRGTLAVNALHGMSFALEALLPLWMTWWSGRYLWRMLAVLAVLAFTIAINCLMSLDVPLLDAVWFAVPALLQMLVLTFAAHALMMPMQLYTQWELRFSDRLPTSATPARQWSLLALLAWTISVALPFTFMRLQHMLEYDAGAHFWSTYWLSVLLKHFLHVTVAAAVLYAALVIGHGSLRRAIIAVALVTACLLARWALSWMPSMYGTTLADHTQQTVAEFVLIGVIGWLLRACGVVLYRPSANEAGLAHVVAGGNST